MNRAELRLLAVSIPDNGLALPVNQALYADYTSDTGVENLYDFIGADADLSFGGIESAQGQSSNFYPLNYGPTEPKPNAQVCTTGHALRAALRVLSSRLGMEDDPLAHDQENYGSGSHLKPNPVMAADTADGDFDAHGYLGSDRLVTEDPVTSDYMNVTGSQTLDYLIEVESDADPQLYNSVVNQPMGMSG